MVGARASCSPEERTGYPRSISKVTTAIKISFLTVPNTKPFARFVFDERWVAVARVTAEEQFGCRPILAGRLGLVVQAFAFGLVAIDVNVRAVAVFAVECFRLKVR